MPWEVKSGLATCSGWAVVKKGGDRPVRGGCHDTQDQAKAHLAALYANYQAAARPGKPDPVHAVVEHHPDCPPHLPHGVTDAGGHLLACHATRQEAQDLALHLDFSDATALTPGGGIGVGAASGQHRDNEPEEPMGQPQAAFDITVAGDAPAWLRAAAGGSRQGNAEKLHEYWVHGDGAAKIRWGEPGDFDRCVEHLGKYLADPKGYCNLAHHAALGIYPATHAEEIKGHASASVPVAVVVSAFNPAQPRVPAGGPGGGQFGQGSGGAAPSNAKPVGQGETGQRVKDLQKRLNALGAKPPLVVDGKFGPKTLAAVKAYQTAHGLKADGLVGPKTTAALRGKQAKPAHPAKPAAHKPAGHTAKPAPAKPAHKPAHPAKTAHKPAAPAKKPASHKTAHAPAKTIPAKTTRAPAAPAPVKTPAAPAKKPAPATPAAPAKHTPAKPAAPARKITPVPARPARTARPGGLFAPGNTGTAPSSAHPIGTGATGPAVRQLQARLNELGARPPLKADGKFGPKTLTAVRAYQQAHGLKADGLVGPLTTAALRGAPAKHAAAPPPAGVQVPALATIPGVDILAAGTWQLSTGRQTFTRDDLAHAIDAARCPAVGPPIIKIGHLDKRFAPQAGQDGEPALGRVTNLRLTDDGHKLLGDLAGMPGWLGVVAASAYPRRSVEGKYRFTCQVGHTHPFVLTALALLGVTPPGVGVLGGLDDVARLYGVTARDGGDPWATAPTDDQTEGGPLVAVTEEDVRRAYYAGAGAPPTWWITELQMAPTQLIIADEDTGKTFRVPFTISGSAVQFGPAEELASYEDVAAARGTGTVVAYASAADSRSVEAKWAAAAQVANLGDNPPASKIKALFALPGSTKTDSSLPHHTVSADGTVGGPDLEGCRAAIAALNGSRGGLKGTSPDKAKAAYTHLAAHVRELGGEPAEFKAAAWGRLDRLQAIRSAVGDTDPDDDVKQLVASLDATLDQASALSASIDRSQVSEPTGQALDLITAAEAIADQLMELLGVFDPDDVAAAGAHGAYTGSHTHPHAAYGTQGGDATHDHPHTHDGDGVHQHAHDPVSAAPPGGGQPTGGGSDMEFTDDQMAAIRAKLGKQDDEDITAEDIAAAFAAPAAPVQGSAGGPPEIGDGTYLVDAEILRGYQQRAAAGDHAVGELRRNERDHVIASAVTAGKFSQARAEHYERKWDSDPDGTRREIEALAAGLVPVGTGPTGKMGFDADLGGDFEGQQAYRQLYGEDLDGQGVTAAPGVRGRR